MASVGIIIPAHNEEKRIQSCLQSLVPFQRQGDLIVVVDASSTDRTGQLSQSCGALVITSQIKSRGLAVALGVKEILSMNPECSAVVIAHADMIFDPKSRHKLLQALNSTSACCGGAFGHRIDSPKWIFRLIEQGNMFRAYWLQMPYGDQAQFFRPDCIELAGGFPQQDWLEDVELSLRLRRTGKLAYLSCPVLIPARHWRNGVLRTTFSNWLTVLRYLAFRPKTASQLEGSL